MRENVHSLKLIDRFQFTTKFISSDLWINTLFYFKLAGPSITIT